MTRSAESGSVRFVAARSSGETNANADLLAA
jgi:hypothetical protein